MAPESTVQYPSRRSRTPGGDEGRGAVNPDEEAWSRLRRGGAVTTASSCSRQRTTVRGLPGLPSRRWRGTKAGIRLENNRLAGTIMDKKATDAGRRARRRTGATMDTARLTFLEYLKRRERKRKPSAETDDTVKRDNLLAHRFVIMETIGSVLQAPDGSLCRHRRACGDLSRQTTHDGRYRHPGVVPGRPDGNGATWPSASVAAEDGRLRRHDAGRHAH